MDRRQSIATPSDAGGSLRGSQVSSNGVLSLNELVAQLMSAVDASGVAIAVQSAVDPTIMVCVARCGETSPSVGALLDINSGISGRAVRENRTLHSEDTSIDQLVERDICERLGIRSLIAVSLSHDSRCVGVLEVFWNQPKIFEPAILGQVEAGAARTLELLSDPVIETKLLNPPVWEEKVATFRLEKDGRLLSPKTASSKVASVAAVRSPKIFSLIEFPGISPVLRPHWRGIALISVAASLAFSAPRLLHRANATSATHTIPSISESASGPRVVADDPESTAALVSDADPSVRVLMAKAVSGSSIAQASLADHYALGDGVTKDRVKAAVWAVIASTNESGKRNKSALQIGGNLQPYEIGQVEYNLGTMFRDGIGTPRNLVNAYSWFSLCGQTGDVRATAALLNLQQVMSAGDISEAQQRAPQLLSHLKN